MYGNAAHERLVDSSHWRESLDLLDHRYMREDVACGLALLVSIADWLGKPVPVARGLLSVASAMTATDLRATGRTLENLGLAGGDTDCPALVCRGIGRGWAALTAPWDRVAVVGPGRMGVGIAAAFAYAGARVELVDVKSRSDPHAAYERCARELNRQPDLLVESSAITAPERTLLAGRVSLAFEATEADAALASAAAIIEAVPEVEAVKRSALARIGARAADDALVLSTTPSFLVDRLAGFVSAPERFLNAHWLNPAFLMPLVEVSPGSRTSASAVSATFELLRAAGKVPVTTAASPGYIVPGLQALVMNEAARMLEEGIASADDIDTASRLGLGLRFAILGVLEFIDWGGLDTLLRASRYFSAEIDGRRFEPSGLV